MSVTVTVMWRVYRLAVYTIERDSPWVRGVSLTATRQRVHCLDTHLIRELHCLLPCRQYKYVNILDFPRALAQIDKLQLLLAKKGTVALGQGVSNPWLFKSSAAAPGEK